MINIPQNKPQNQAIDEDEYLEYQYSDDVWFSETNNRPRHNIDYDYISRIKPKKPTEPLRTTKQIAASLIEKDERKKAVIEAKGKGVTSEGLRIAKQQALKARRREFASNKARLILIMIEADQDYVCAKCKSEDNLTVDHVFPLSKGGTDDLSNLIFLCQSCNSKKGVTIIESIDDIGGPNCHGVTYRKDNGKWRSQIKINKKTISLGCFSDKFEAICARKSAENKYKEKNNE